MSSLLCVAFWALSVQLALAETCLPDAVPASQRSTLIQDPQGAAVLAPLRVLNSGWPSVSIVSELFHIIVTEVLGMNATVEVAGGSSIGALYAAAGCTNPGNAQDRGCPDKVLEFQHHAVILEVWQLSGRLPVVEQAIKGFSVEDLGSIGYSAVSRLGGKGATRSLAYQTNGVALDYYRSYNTSWTRPWEFFSNTSAVSNSKLRPCSESTFAESHIAQAHVQFTNDVGGVEYDAEGHLVLRCWDGFWWRAPTCRDAPETCIPVVTGGTGWYADAMAMWAAAHDMPLAIAVGLTSSDYRSIPTEADTLFYFYEPDSTFLDLDPFSITFEENDLAAWSELDKRTGPPVQVLSKVVTRGLQFESPMVHQFARNMQLSKNTMNDLLRAFSTNDGSSTVWDVACNWLKANEGTWREWVPDSTSCIPKQGMVDHQRNPVFDRSEATSCEWCPAGTFSERMEQDVWVTHVCRPCPPGQYQNLPGQVDCKQCPSGKYANASGADQCLRCNKGSYAPEEGQEVCQLCGPGSVSGKEGATECRQCSPGTMHLLPGGVDCDRCPEGTFQPLNGAEKCNSCQDVLLNSNSSRGAVNESECMCRVGFVQQVQTGVGPVCQDCGAFQGLDCPGGRDEPAQVAGHWVEVVDPANQEYSVFLCRNVFQCPGGPLGACARGREGKACNSCMHGYYPTSDGQCEPCSGPSSVPLICAAMLAPFAVVAILAFLKTDSTTQPMTTMTIVATAGQLFTALQALGSLQQLQIQLAQPAQFLMSMAGLLALDLNFLRVPCLFQRDDPVSQFALKLVVLPALAVLLGITLLLSKAAKRPIERTTVYNTMGMFNTVFFISITLTVLLPLQCRVNPNGKLSVLSEPGIECFSSDTHMALVILAAVGIVAFPLTILSWAIKATVRYPALVRTEKGLNMLRGQRFFFSRFKNDRYYFAMVLFIRNMLVALIPVVLVGLPAIQCSAMGLVLLVVFGLEATLWPWRTHASNLSALLLDGLLILAVITVGPTIDTTSPRSQQAISWYVACCIFGLVGAAVGFLAINIFKRLRRERLYGAFLCHHKAGAGALARQIKMLMQVHCRSSIFLDSDELDDLERLFDVVRCDTWNLVILMSGDVLSRIWCAGEIATAHRNRVKMIAMPFDKFSCPNELQIQAIISGWTEEERKTLLAHDITLGMVTAAYARLAALPQIRATRSAGLGSKEAAVQELVSCCQLPRHFASGADEFHEGKSDVAIAILGAVGNIEVLASCEILQMMLQETLQVPVRVVQAVPESSSPLAFSLLAVLTPGVLENTTFAETLLVYHGSATPVPMVSVLADNYFQFPTPEFYAKLEDTGLPTLDKSAGHRLVDAYSELFSTIALPFSPLASEAVLKLEVSELCRRRFRSVSASKGTFSLSNGDALKAILGGTSERSVTTTSAASSPRAVSQAVIGGVSDKSFTNSVASSPVASPQVGATPREQTPLPEGMVDEEDDNCVPSFSI